MGENSSKIGVILSTKTIITQKLKSEIWFFFLFNRFRICHVKFKTFEQIFFFNSEKWWTKTIPSSGPIVMPIVTNIFLALKKFRNMKLSENFCLSVIFFQKIDWFIYCLKSCKTCAKKIWQAFYVFLTRLTDVRQLFLSTIIYFVLMATSDTSLVLPIPH